MGGGGGVSSNDSAGYTSCTVPACCKLDGTLLQSTGCPSSGNESTLRHVGDCCLWTTALYLLKNWEVKVTDASVQGTKSKAGSSAQRV